MNWTVLAIAFCLAVVSGASAASLFARTRPGWSERKRLVAASLLLPVMTALATLAAIVAMVAASEGQAGDMRDLALRAVASFGAGFAALAFVGGLVGAALRQRGMRR